MSRERKYRAWNGKQMLDWEWIKEMGLVSQVIINSDGIYEVMEYTGLKDKQGKEIYEDDIVRQVIYRPDGKIGVVKFGEGDYNPDWYGVTWWGWYIEGIDTVFYGDTDKIVKDFEVIGNIHEHPGLLKS